MPYVEIACRALLITVFLIAVAGKVRGRTAFQEFTASLTTLGIFSRAGSAVAAYALVGAEAVTPLLLVSPPTAPLGFAAATGTLAVLTGGVLIALRRGRRTPCRCFGRTATPLGPAHVIRNLILTAIGCTGLVAWAAGGAAAHPAGVALALAAAVVGALLVVRLDDLMELFTA
ncbi:MauE/DoxX family redox-associated membrane protein [Rhizohabitans arisaemae]|uniref:MauE/DoxX family redox-associated membrane protein n=1 Tax=Rhizohabitans arisaemae TaxID=2720610 RepID=UPI0024B04611|nr:MauE/DoxX family redox-associated membrane protein [Rhizohabitans arisaemae]